MLVPDEWLWNGRHVKLVDGFTVSLPDTEANQAEYPQSRSQQAGVGFPLARCVVLLSLATGMVADLEIGPYAGKETGETALLRNLLHRLWAKALIPRKRGAPLDTVRARRIHWGSPNSISSSDPQTFFQEDLFMLYVGIDQHRKGERRGPPFV